MLTSPSSFPHSYILGLNVSDHTGQTWLSAFNEQALPILGNVSANELVALKDQDQTRYEQVVQSAVFKTYNFKVRAKMENYQVCCWAVVGWTFPAWNVANEGDFVEQDEQKVKLSVVSATPVDYAELSHQLLETVGLFRTICIFREFPDRVLVPTDCSIRRRV